MTNSECLERAIALSREHGDASILDQGLLPTHYRVINGMDSVSVHTMSYGTDLYTHTSPHEVCVSEMREDGPTGVSETMALRYGNFDEYLDQNMLGLISHMCGNLERAHKQHPDQVLHWFMLPGLPNIAGTCETVRSGALSIDVVRGPEHGGGILCMRYGFTHLAPHETVISWPRLRKE